MALPDPQFTVDRALSERAARMIEPYGLRTPLRPSALLSELAGRPVFLKCDNHQRTGSFKVRGALARLLALDRQRRARGVIAASAGNHGLGLAWACRQLGVPGLVVVPETTPKNKLLGLQRMMIKVRRHGRGYDDAERYARELAERDGATFVSPFDDRWIIAGNGGTIALELEHDLPGCEAIVVPVGGGGLASGIAVTLHRDERRVPHIVGANTAASPAMARSLAEQRVYRTYDSEPTLAEGLEGGVGDTTAALCARHLHSVEIVSEAAIGEAIAWMARHQGLVIEGSAAAAVAVLLQQRPVPGDGELCVVLTGRNIDHQRLRRLLG